MAPANPSETWVGGVRFALDSSRYKVLGLLGQGSFGTVAAGIDRNTGKKLAIKHISPVAGDRSDARHILREVVIMRLLRYHPNIISLEDFRVDMETSTLYIVMELMECDLERVLASGQDLTHDHVQVLLKQLLLGIQAMHRHGIMHRDLKPENVLILSDCQLRITDFGLSRLVKSIPNGGQGKGVDDALNMTGYVVTRWYRAPEVMLGPEGGYAEPVDMWSVGCIFGELLGCRSALFPGKNYIDQVGLTLATLGIPDTESSEAFGYELSKDALRFLQNLDLPKRRPLESLLSPDVDEEALDLLRNILRVNTQERLTASQALRHPFLSDCPALPTTLTPADRDDGGPPLGEPFVGPVNSEAIQFSFEDEGLSLDDLRKLILAEAASYQAAARVPLQPSERTPRDRLQPALSLEDVFGAVRTQARQNSGNERGVRAAERANEPGAAGAVYSTPDSPHLYGRAVDKRFSSMANVAGARGWSVDGLGESPRADSGSSEKADDQEVPDAKGSKHYSAADMESESNRGQADENNVGRIGNENMNALSKMCDIIPLSRREGSPTIAVAGGHDGTGEGVPEVTAEADEATMNIARTDDGHNDDEKGTTPSGLGRMTSTCNHGKPERTDADLNGELQGGERQQTALNEPEQYPPHFDPPSDDVMESGRPCEHKSTSSSEDDIHGRRETVTREHGDVVRDSAQGQEIEKTDCTNEGEIPGPLHETTRLGERITSDALKVQVRPTRTPTPVLSAALGEVCQVDELLVTKQTDVAGGEDDGESGRMTDGHSISLRAEVDDPAVAQKTPRTSDQLEANRIDKSLCEKEDPCLSSIVVEEVRPDATPSISKPTKEDRAALATDATEDTMATNNGQNAKRSSGSAQAERTSTDSSRLQERGDRSAAGDTHLSAAGLSAGELDTSSCVSPGTQEDATDATSCQSNGDEGVAAEVESSDDVPGSIRVEQRANDSEFSVALHKAEADVVANAVDSDEGRQLSGQPEKSSPSDSPRVISSKIRAEGGTGKQIDDAERICSTGSSDDEGGAPEYEDDLKGEIVAHGLPEITNDTTVFVYSSCDAGLADKPTQPARLPLKSDGTDEDQVRIEEHLTVRAQLFHDHQVKADSNACGQPRRDTNVPLVMEPIPPESSYATTKPSGPETSGCQKLGLDAIHTTRRSDDSQAPGGVDFLLCAGEEKQHHVADRANAEKRGGGKELDLQWAIPGADNHPLPEENLEGASVTGGSIVPPTDPIPGVAMRDDSGSEGISERFNEVCGTSEGSGQYGRNAGTIEAKDEESGNTKNSSPGGVRGEEAVTDGMATTSKLEPGDARNTGSREVEASGGISDSGESRAAQESCDPSISGTGHEKSGSEHGGNSPCVTSSSEGASNSRIASAREARHEEGESDAIDSTDHASYGGGSSCGAVESDAPSTLTAKSGLEDDDDCRIHEYGVQKPAGEHELLVARTGSETGHRDSRDSNSVAHAAKSVACACSDGSTGDSVRDRQDETGCTVPSPSETSHGVSDEGSLPEGSRSGSTPSQSGVKDEENTSTDESARVSFASEPLSAEDSGDALEIGDLRKVKKKLLGSAEKDDESIPISSGRGEACDIADSPCDAQSHVLEGATVDARHGAGGQAEEKNGCRGEINAPGDAHPGLNEAQASEGIRSDVDCGDGALYVSFETNDQRREVQLLHSSSPRHPHAQLTGQSPPCPSGVCVIESEERDDRSMDDSLSPNEAQNPPVNKTRVDHSIGSKAQAIALPQGQGDADDRDNFSVLEALLDETHCFTTDEKSTNGNSGRMDSGERTFASDIDAVDGGALRESGQNTTTLKGDVRLDADCGLALLEEGRRLPKQESPRAWSTPDDHRGCPLLEEKWTDEEKADQEPTLQNIDRGNPKETSSADGKHGMDRHSSVGRLAERAEDTSLPLSPTGAGPKSCVETIKDASSSRTHGLIGNAKGTLSTEDLIETSWASELPEPQGGAGVATGSPNNTEPGILAVNTTQPVRDTNVALPYQNDRNTTSERDMPVRASPAANDLERRVEDIDEALESDKKMKRSLVVYRDVHGSTAERTSDADVDSSRQGIIEAAQREISLWDGDLRGSSNGNILPDINGAPVTRNVSEASTGFGKSADAAETPGTTLSAGREEDSIRAMERHVVSEAVNLSRESREDVDQYQHTQTFLAPANCVGVPSECESFEHTPVSSEAGAGGKHVLDRERTRRGTNDEYLGHDLEGRIEPEFIVTNHTETPRHHHVGDQALQEHTDIRNKAHRHSENVPGTKKTVVEHHSLPQDEQDEHKRRSHAAIKIQTCARGRAASIRVCAVRRRKNLRSKTSRHVPALPIASSTAGSTPTIARRIPSKGPREPLAILRKLQEQPQSSPTHKTDQFMLRMTTKSAIDAHVRKTGALRRKPHPLPTPPVWRASSTGVKVKPRQPWTAISNPLIKPHVISLLHRSVKEVNPTMPASKLRRSRSAGASRVHDRLICAIFAAETLVQREYEDVE